MTTKAELAAKAKFDNFIMELSNSVTEGTQANTWNTNERIFNVKSAIALVRKAKLTAEEYGFDLEPLIQAQNKVFSDLMEQKKFDQAEKFAKELNL